MLRDDINMICEIAAANGIALDPDFDWGKICRHGFFDEPRKVAEKVAAQMLAICKNGVAGGFNSDMRSALKELSSIVAELSTVDAIDAHRKKFEKLQKRSEKAMAEKIQPTGGHKELVAIILRSIDSALSAIDTFIKISAEGNTYCKLTDEQKRYFELSREKLNELKGEVLKVVDTSSKSALEYYKKTLASLLRWRDVFANRMLTASSMRLLDNAKEAVEDWQKCVATVKSSNAAKDKDVEECAVYPCDDVDLISGCFDKLEELSAFKSRMDEDAEQIKLNKKQLQKLASEKEACDTELATLDDEDRKSVIEYKKTGDKVKFHNTAERIRLRREYLAERSKDIELKMIYLQNDIANKEDLHKQIASVYDDIRQYEKDPIMLSLILGGVDDERGVDFNALAHMFNGLYDQKEVEKASNSIMRISTYIVSMRRKRVETLEMLEKTKTVIENTTPRIANPVLKPQVVETTQKNASGLTAYEEQLMAKYGDVSEEEKVEPEKEKADDLEPIYYGDDDK